MRYSIICENAAIFTLIWKIYLLKISELAKISHCSVSTVQVEAAIEVYCGVAVLKPCHIEVPCQLEQPGILCANPQTRKTNRSKEITILSNVNDPRPVLTLKQKDSLF